MGAIPDFLLTHSCVIEPWLGTTGEGADSFAPAVGIPRCFIDEARKLVRGNGQQGTGDEVTSGVVIYMPLTVDSSVFLPGSRVTYTASHGSTVTEYITSVKRRDGRGLPTPDHVEVSCG